MRTIKFRAWDKEKKVMIGSDYKHNKSKYTREDNDEVYENIFFLSLSLIEDLQFDYKDRLVIQQYTGLTDKNGKPIYEGDIIQHGSSQTIVSWEDYIDQDFYWGNAVGFVFNFEPELMAMGSKLGFEVIGNIYEGIN